MALRKRETGIQFDHRDRIKIDRKTGKPIIGDTTMTRSQRKSLTLIPTTPAPKTRGARIARALWG